jgi:hypothetical protein
MTEEGRLTRFVLQISCEATDRIEIAQGWMLPAYGNKRRNIMARFRIVVILPSEFSLEISYIGYLAEEART